MVAKNAAMRHTTPNTTIPKLGSSTIASSDYEFRKDF